nr:MAG TPA: hypothetical protein [Caudoviricetes sp.]
MYKFSPFLTTFPVFCSLSDQFFQSFLFIFLI